VLWTGCGGGSNNGTSLGNARLRIVDASPDAPNMNILIDGSAAVTQAAFRSASGYQSVAAGTHQITAVVAGANPATTLVTSEISLNSGTDNTLLVIGRNDNGSLRVVTVPDNNSSPITGQAKLRVIDAATSANINVDVYVSAPGADLTTLFPTFNLTYGSATDYTALAAGAAEIRMTPSGVKTPVLLDTGTLNLAAGQIRTIVTVDSTAAGPPASALVLADKN
jgi:hypothetical protein